MGSGRLGAAIFGRRQRNGGPVCVAAAEPERLDARGATADGRGRGAPGSSAVDLQGDVVLAKIAKI